MDQFDFQKILQCVVDNNLSEVRLVVGAPPIVRVNRHLVRLECRQFTSEDLAELTSAITPVEKLEELDTYGQIEFRYSLNDDVQFQITIDEEGPIVVTRIEPTPL